MQLCNRCETPLKGEELTCIRCQRGRRYVDKRLQALRKLGNKEEIHTVLWNNARHRARIKSLPIKQHQVEIPDFCPILGLKLKVNNKVISDNSYSFDRIIPELGYVPGNVICISQRANRIKNDSTLDELEKIFYFYRDFY